MLTCQPAPGDRKSPATFIKPIHTPADGGQKLNVLGIPMVIRIHGRDTGGVVSSVESHDVPGGGPPPHIHHREDETFQILEGDYEFTVDGKAFIAQRGATIFAPRGIPHTYRYLGQTPGRLMCVITPKGRIGMQVPKGEAFARQEVRFRNIRVKELKNGGDHFAGAAAGGV